MIYIRPKVTSVLLNRDDKMFRIKKYDETLKKCKIGDTLEIIHKHFKTRIKIKFEDDIDELYTSIIFNTIKYKVRVENPDFIVIKPVYPMPLFYRGEVIYGKLKERDISCLV